MKLKNLLVCALLFVTTPAFAYDKTYMATVRPKESRSINVHLPKGNSTVEIWDVDNNKLTCNFQLFYVKIEQAEVYRCTINSYVKDSDTATVSISNPNDVASDYKIWIRSVK